MVKFSTRVLWSRRGQPPFLPLLHPFPARARKTGCKKVQKGAEKCKKVQFYGLPRRFLPSEAYFPQRRQFLSNFNSGIPRCTKVYPSVPSFPIVTLFIPYPRSRLSVSPPDTASAPACSAFDPGPRIQRRAPQILFGFSPAHVVEITPVRCLTPPDLFRD
jgi:hypothetical protein